MLSCLGSAGVGAASPLRLPTAASLPGELDAALRLQRPLVVMVSLEGCPFCKTVREHHLVGLLQEGQPVVQVDMRSNARVLDFAGQGRTHDEVIQAWKVAIAPTVLFFGKGAREAAPRLQGLSSPDFYGAYLEQRLEAARQDVRSRQR
jgi:hypothetical protein